MGFLHTRYGAITQDYPGVTILISTTITALNERARYLTAGGGQVGKQPVYVDDAASLRFLINLKYMYKYMCVCARIK